MSAALMQSDNSLCSLTIEQRGELQEAWLPQLLYFQNVCNIFMQPQNNCAELQEAGIPHTRQSVEELFSLVDIDGSGIMEWSEFETFVANEIQEGRDLMEGEFVLPSGAGIQFAAMVDVLRRKSRLAAIMKVLHLTHFMTVLSDHARNLPVSFKASDSSLSLVS